MQYDIWEEGQPETDLTPEVKKINRKLEKVKWLIGGEPVTLKTFAESMPDEVTIPNRKSPAEKSVFKDIKTYVRRYLNSDVNILNKLDKLQEERDFGKRVSVVSTELNLQEINVDWASQLKNFKFTNANDRQNIYDYWENISKRFELVQNALTDLETGYDKILEEGLEDSNTDFLEVVKELIEYKDNKNLKYVHKIGKIRGQISTTEKTVEAISRAFLVKKVGYDIFKEELLEQETLQTRNEEGDVNTFNEILDESEVVDDSIRVEYESNKMNMQSLDPILYYETTVNKVTTINKKEYENTRDLIIAVVSDLMGYSVETSSEQQQVVEEIKDFVNEYEKVFEIRGSKFYLPATDFLGGKIEETEKTTKDKKEIKLLNVEEINETIEKFLETIAKASKFSDIEFTYVSGGFTGEGKGGDRNPLERRSEKRMARAINTSKKRSVVFPQVEIEYEKGDETKVKTFEKAWGDLLDAVNKYYLKPAQSPYFVSQKEKPRWVRSGAAWKISMDKADMNPVGAAIKFADYTAFAHIKEDEIKELINFVNFIKRGKITDSRVLLNNGKMVVKALDSIFGPSFREDNRIDIADFIVQYINKNMGGTYMINGEETPVEDIKFFRRPIIQWQDKHQKNELYPLDYLREVVETPEFKGLLGFGEGREGKRSAGKRARSGAFMSEKDAVLRKLLTLSTILSDIQKMDEVNAALLDAHDSIRKMNGEQIIEGYLSLNNIEDMDYIITKFEDRLSITALEIEGIVKSVNSYRGISRHYGIPEETVYEIKAMFR